MVRVLFFLFLLMPFLDGMIEVGGGVRCDDLTWSIPGPDGTPNVLSELTWKDIRSRIVTFQWRGMIPLTCFYYRLNADYGWIYQGKSRDSDYNGDDRTLEFSRAFAKSDKGEVWDYSAAAGRVFSFAGFQIAYLGGWSKHEQHLRMFDGETVIQTNNPSLIGPIEGLNSSYKTRWEGAWVGFDLLWVMTQCMIFSASYENHYAHYHGVGHWNLREDLLSDFKHKAKGHGRVYSGQLAYYALGSCYVALGGDYQRWKTKKGRNNIVVAIDFEDDDDVVAVKVTSSLNPVKWHAYRVYLTVGF